MGLSNLFKRLNTNIEAMEQELTQAYDRITMLEGELAHLCTENEDLRCELEASANNQYD